MNPCSHAALARRRTGAKWQSLIASRGGQRNRPLAAEHEGGLSWFLTDAGAAHSVESVNVESVNVESVNEVRLVGRLAAIGEPKTLPSGDELRPFRLVVDRPRVNRAGVTTARRVDAIDCHALSAVARRRLERLEAGARVEVRGALRRRFFRGAAGVASRYEVEATTVRRIRAAASAAAR